MTKEQLLEKANRDYPIGTSFYKIRTDEICVVCSEPDEFGGTVSVKDKKENWPYVFNGRQWAEIISKPEQTPIAEFGIDRNGNVVAEISKVATPQPLNIEDDPRYKELLDEESKKYLYADYDNLNYEVEGEPEPTQSYCKSISDAEYRFGYKSIEIFNIKISAQRIYFEEKLQEKTNAMLAISIDCHETIKILNDAKNRALDESCGLTATIAEKDKDIDQIKEDNLVFFNRIRLENEEVKDEYKKQLSESNAEVEKLKQELNNILEQEDISPYRVNKINELL